MRRNLPVILVVLAIVAAMVVAPCTAAVGSVAPGGARLHDSSDVTLSFKPFTAGDLIHFKLELDLADIGKPIHSAKLDLIEKQTSEVRELPLKKQVKFVEVTEPELRLETIVEFNVDTPPAEISADQKLLVALGLFPKDKNLEKVLTDVYTEQIAGSYDTETKEITIVGGKGTSSAMDEITMSHEVTHALQDQNYGLDKPPLDVKSYNGDNDLAITSLIEGDAMNTMVLYARAYFSLGQIAQLSQQKTPASPVLDASPLYIQRSLLFPYEEGLRFVQDLASKGEGPVDKALADPPLSSEQIIHPEKYITARDNPKPVPLADISSSLGQGWKKINEDALGEFDYNTWFEQYFPKAGMPSVGKGWGGNTIQYYQGPGSKHVLVSDTVWDTPKDAKEFYDAYAKLLTKQFGSKLKKVGSSSNAYVYQAEGVLYYLGMTGDATLQLQAPDRATLTTTLKQYPQFPAAP